MRAGREIFRTGRVEQDRGTHYRHRYGAKGSDNALRHPQRPDTPGWHLGIPILMVIHLILLA